MIRSITSRLTTIVSVSLLFAQLIVLASYYGLIKSRPDLEDISVGLTQSDYLLSSPIAEYMTTPVVFGVLCVLFVGSCFKEVRFRKSRARLIGLNLLTLVVFSVIFGIASQAAFLPITHHGG